ncbi:unnamed protein product [Protopolystoma xenopodis]|uniref:Uncharacterized protein n=1 Tax=Protopolystoma xenopodis TaxID=117903 RepID=A0A3S5AQM6_9PLAT|nr:unnamed protein product [Protopolystoma xenopodis]
MKGYEEAHSDDSKVAQLIVNQILDGGCSQSPSQELDLCPYIDEVKSASESVIASLPVLPSQPAATHSCTDAKPESELLSNFRLTPSACDYEDCLLNVYELPLLPLVPPSPSSLTKITPRSIECSPKLSPNFHHHPSSNPLPASLSNVLTLSKLLWQLCSGGSSLF